MAVILRDSFDSFWPGNWRLTCDVAGLIDWFQRRLKRLNEAEDFPIDACNRFRNKRHRKEEEEEEKEEEEEEDGGPASGYHFPASVIS